MMTVVQRTVGLTSELEDFLAEVDSISSANIKDMSFPPVSEWVVNVDPVTRVPTYSNLLSGETTVHMPESYKCYLVEFGQYLQLPFRLPSSPDLSALREPFLKPSNFPPIETTERCKSTENTATFGDVPVTCSELKITGYSDSSDNASTHASYLTCPPASNDTRTESEDMAKSLTVPPPACLRNQMTCSTVARIASDDSGKHDSNFELRMKKMIRSVKKRFGSIGIRRRRIEPLHYLYAQMMGRVEDWLNGELSSDYMMKRLQEVDTKLTDHISNHPSPIQRPNLVGADVASADFDQPVSQYTSEYQPSVITSEHPDNVSEEVNRLNSVSAGTLRKAPPASVSDVEADAMATSRRKHLQAQLAEFELACAQFEEKLTSGCDAIAFFQHHTLHH